MAFVRASNVLKAYLDGTYVASSVTANNQNHSVTSSNALQIGRLHTNDFTGKLDEIRISKGVARYTSNFTPSTSAFSSDSNTKLLIHSDNGGNVGAYGTAQSDGRSYYYTDVPGSKPIKDPRIGAHFGSQRHRISSMQILEQETAANGNDVKSCDGREWVRGVRITGASAMNFYNDGNGQRFQLGNGASHQMYLEIIGYFSDANILGENYASSQPITIQIDGASAVTKNPFSGSIQDPKRGRYVNSNTVANLALGATLGIHTLRINSNSQENQCSGFELIAQDTGSTARKSQINIPAQSVVSYGKKFNIGSDTLTNAVHKHYNPFAFKTDGTTAWASGAHNGTSWPVGTGSSHNIDTATSLGLSNWLHSSNYYKPYNGGRVVVWVASDGTIKTSVNMMPPNAKGIGNSSSLTNGTAKANASVANNTFYPTFEVGLADNSLAEVAKTFHIREFGNGSANGGSAGAAKADCSMLSGTADDIAYTMDDGLTSFSGDDMETNVSHWPAIMGSANGDGFYIAFIGTGISAIGIENLTTRKTFAQNLPYGTHILRVYKTSGSASSLKIDGVAFGDSPEWPYSEINEITFHQPKKPPIPEDACVLADYMLMADFVPQTASGTEKISKGVRSVNASRDCWYDKGSASGSFDAINPQPLAMGGFEVSYDTGGQSAGLIKQRLPFFGTNFVSRNYNHNTRATISLDGTTKTGGDRTINGDTNRGSYAHLTTSVTLGTYLSGKENAANQNPEFNNMDIVTPIHTSSHYQIFETPYTTELVGGDRNMEQTNLVVTSDGKTWDEVTRDTSYMGNTVVFVRDHEGWNSNMDWSIQRGKGPGSNKSHMVFKDSWVNSYDRFVCLKTGYYTVNASILIKDQTHFQFRINGTDTYMNHSPNFTSNTPHAMAVFNFTHYFERGDTLQGNGQRYGDAWAFVSILKDEVE